MAIARQKSAKDEDALVLLEIQYKQYISHDFGSKIVQRKRALELRLVLERP